MRVLATVDTVGMENSIFHKMDLHGHWEDLTNLSSERKKSDFNGLNSKLTIPTSSTFSLACAERPLGRYYRPLVDIDHFA